MKALLKNILPNFAIKFLIKSKTFFLDFGTSDYYPHLKNSHKFFFGKNFSLPSKFRISFWNYFAKKHPNIKHFYHDKPELSFVNSKEYSQIRKYKQEIYEFYKNGVSQIDNFFSKDDHNSLIELFKKKLDSNYQKESKHYGYVIENENINKIIHENIKDLEEIFFGKKIAIKKYLIETVVTRNNKSSTGSHQFHLDRFVPAIKLIYFLTDVNIDPFEFYQGSHIINKQYLDNALIEAKNIGHTSVEQRFNFQNYEVKSFNVPANTMLIAATHAFHRRRMDNVDGERKFIRIDYYNDFTIYDLLKYN